MLSKFFSHGRVAFKQYYKAENYALSYGSQNQGEGISVLFDRLRCIHRVLEEPFQCLLDPIKGYDIQMAVVSLAMDARPRACLVQQPGCCNTRDAVRAAAVVIGHVCRAALATS